MAIKMKQEISAPGYAGKFTFERSADPKPKPDPNTLKFGQTFSDHMFIMEYSEGRGWHGGRIVPYGPIALDPAAAVLHYGQEMFEGMKAYRAQDGRVLLFRPGKNAERVANSCDRICIPRLDDGLFVAAVKAIVDVERGWIPEKEGTSLYIRPFIFADEPFLGVHAARHYLFVIICSPVGPYYDTPGGGLSPTNIYVEREYVRAAPGGTGFAKVGGNYAGSLKAQATAAERGCEQVLWLDAVERKYVEEIGTSNAFFVVGGEAVTAPLAGTILPGVTRDSVITLLKKWDIPVSERRLTIDDVFAAGRDGSLQEIFASGTAAVISPVGKLVSADGTLTVGGGSVGPLAQRLYDALYGIQTGRLTDELGWTVTV
ncbi:MAG: branched-chain amino acid aminotransferase [Oscillospiraceae bacterium]|jgi:branched-chain amino acid aminotransferase|nr:branched-chain amino acid aminotransferase [Oscillospiraceae bacterium]